MTVDPKKFTNECERKKTATPIAPITIAIQITLNKGLRLVCSSVLAKNFQPWRLVAWQKCSKHPEEADWLPIFDWLSALLVISLEKKEILNSNSFQNQIFLVMKYNFDNLLILKDLSLCEPSEMEADYKG